MAPSTRAKNGSQQLLPQHRALISASGISPEVAAARGYRSVQTKAELKRLGFGSFQCRVPALLIPIRDATGEIVNYQIRSDEPRVRHGKVVKYETPRDSRMAVDVPPPAREEIGDPEVPLFITEGIRKADSAVSKGLCCIALLGVWSFRGTNEYGGLTALADWEYIALKGRQVFICFDSDVMTTPGVHEALARLKAFLEHRGAHVSLIYLPPGPAGGKVGLDDFLAEGHGVADLMALASSELRRADAEEVDGNRAGPYLETESGLVLTKHTRDGDVHTPLTNFRAKIIGQVVEDDGAETRRLMEIEAHLNDRVTRFAVTANEYSRMEWPLQHLGATAVVHAGFGAKEHARTAIQLLSREVPERRVYAHTGWRKIGDAWCYLHAGGAIGPDGPVGDVEVHLPRELMGYQVPTPPADEELRAAARASLRLLEVAPDRVSVPVFCMVCRAPLGTSNFSGYLVGRTGLYKTSVAALAQAHFGAEMDFGNLPADWTSTANYLESLAFAAKDALLTVDDLVPRGSRVDRDRQQRDTDRLLRGQANRSGRGRLRADSTPRPPRPPRGLILTTGEDLLRGESLSARVSVVEFRQGDVDVSALTACQADAAEGLYASAMAGYVRWLATRYAQILADLPSEVRDLRTALTRPGMHPRTPDIVANLAVGLRCFIRFAQDVNALTREEAEALWERGWAALEEAAAAQAAHIGTAEPAGLFIRLLLAAITSGRAHLDGVNGGVPPNPAAWGWRDESGAWQPHGDLVGWLDGKDIYLQPNASFAVAAAVGRATGEEITVSPYTLRRRLHERGLLAFVDVGREKLTVRRTLGGRRHDVLSLHADSLSRGDDRRIGPVSGAGCGSGSGNRPTADSPRTPQNAPQGGGGPIGPVGPVSRAQKTHGGSGGPSRRKRARR